MFASWWNRVTHSKKVALVIHLPRIYPSSSTTAITTTTTTTAPTTMSSTIATTIATTTTRQITSWLENTSVQNSVENEKMTSMIINTTATSSVHGTFDIYWDLTTMFQNLMIYWTSKDQRHSLIFLVCCLIFLFLTIIITTMLLRLSRRYSRMQRLFQSQFISSRKQKNCRLHSFSEHHQFNRSDYYYYDYMSSNKSMNEENQKKKKNIKEKVCLQISSRHCPHKSIHHSIILLFLMNF